MVGGVVLLDEPELSMHPKWQQKVLEYYRSLFTAEGVQNAQMIFYKIVNAKSIVFS